MKNYLLILLAINAFPLFGQISFPDSNAIWNVNRVSSTGIPTTEILYGLMGDTLINDTLYNKLYLLSDTTLAVRNLQDYLGGFRQENQKVWFRPKDLNEFLLYDFMKQIGDTVWYEVSLYIDSEGIHHSFESDNKFNIIQNIVNEENFKRIILYCDYNKQDEWLTGIGSKYGPFGPINQIALSGNSYHLACFKQNDTIKYSANLICSKCFCSGLSGTIEKISCDDWIKMFPNPVENSLSIQIDKLYSQIRIEILNDLGNTIYDKGILEDPINMNISLSGFYIIRLTIDSETITKKLIIE